MAKANIKAVFKWDVKKVWDTVTNLEDCSWRSDLSRIEIVNQNQFIEHTKDGYQTTFAITKTEPCNRWEFDMETDNMKGHWIGIFSQNGEETTVDFTEDVTSKKVLMKPFVNGYLKKQQSLYIADLEKALER